MGAGRWTELCRKPVLCEAPEGSRGHGDEGHRENPVKPAEEVASTTTTVPSAGPVAGSRSFLSRLREGDEIARVITFLFAASVVLVTLLLVVELWQGSVLPRHKFGFNFFRTSVWDPIFDQFGALPFIFGTTVTAGVALLREYIQPGLKDTLGFLPLFQGPAYGVGFLTAGVVLAIMVIPYIISVSREVLLSVPRDQREAALSLGATRWESTWKVVVPFARGGIFGSIFLALARALGETMAVTMVIGNTPTISASLFSPGYSIAAVIANEFTEATGDLYLQSLIELGLVLFLLTFILNGLARLLILLTSQRGSEMSHV